MKRKSTEYEEIKQRIDENLLLDLEQHPSQIERWYINNIFGRAFSYLVGLTERKVAKTLRCTDAGILKVANVGSGLSYVYPESGTAAATLSGATLLDEVCSQIRVISKDYPFNLYPSPDGVTYYGPVYIPANGDKTFDLTVHSFKTQRTGANDAIYTVEGFK